MDVMMRRRELMGMQTGGLPGAYEQHLFLQADDQSPFIQTEYIPKIGDECVFAFNIPSAIGANASPFYAGDGTYQFGMTLSSASINAWFKFFATGSAPRSRDFALSQNHTGVITSSGSLYIDNVYQGVTPPTGELDGDAIRLRLFARSGNTTTPLKWGKIGRFTISHDGLVKLDLIPCVRKTDGVCGMFDAVSRVFYTNALSTGQFSVSD